MQTLQQILTSLTAIVMVLSAQVGNLTHINPNNQNTAAVVEVLGASTITAGTGTASGTIGTTPQDISVTVTPGSNPVLFVAIGTGGAGAVASVTYNGASLTKLYGQVDGAGWSESSAWILTNPSAGTNTLHVVWASNPPIARVWAQPFYGVAQGGTQGTTWRTPASGNGNSATASVNVSNAVSGDTVLDVVSDYGQALTNNSSQTLQFQDNVSAGAMLRWGTSSKSVTGATTMQWTMASAYWAMGAVALIPAVGAPFDTTPPSTPTNLSATAVSSSQINLSWTASTDDYAVTGYKIYRGGVQAGTSATNSYSDTGLSPSTLYTYNVSAYDGAGNNSSQSSSASATTQAPAPTPPVISSFSASPTSINSGQSSTLSWSVSNATSLSISSIGSVSGTSISVSPTLTTTYTLTASNATGQATANTTITVTVPDTMAPSTPTNLSATSISSSQINLSWTSSTDNTAVTGYNIYRVGTKIGTSATNSYSDTGLSASTNYSYTVSAYDAAGNTSSQSSSASATTQTTPPQGTYPWSGILDPSRATDWSQVGIPGGIPNRTTICATINASTYGNGASDATAGIQNALNSCPQNQVVLLSAGTFRINSSINIPSYKTLRGAGAHDTILDLRGNARGAINMGTSDLGSGGAVNITGGTGAGSTSITVSNASGITVGSYLHINELNDPSYVTINGAGSCTWCDEWWNGTRVRGQISEVTSVNGNTIGISPGLYNGYTRTPQAIPFQPLVKWAGVENLQVYANNTGYTTNFLMDQSAYSWIKGVESNFADGDHVNVWHSYHDEIRDSYFHDAYRHTSGGTDADIFIAERTTGTLVENNILTRMHISVMLNWGAAGNVVAYNYTDGNYDTSATNVLMYDLATHGAHPQYTLWEGNVTSQIRPDSYWGSTSNNTMFRNWALGVTQICLPYSTRGAPGACHSSTQGNDAINIDFTNAYDNLVGNIAGSAAMRAASPSGEVAYVVAGETRSNYGGFGYDIAIGYNDVSDNTGSGTCTGSRASCLPYYSSLIHGNYTNANNTTAWAMNIPSGHSPANPNQALPASFYKTSKPAWWGSLPWPAIGPDVTGGTGPGGHTSLTASNPAQACYNNTPKDSNGYLIFNPDNCYGTGTPPPTDTTPPTVSITAPTAGATVSGSSVTLTASASDPSVSGQATSGVAGVQFLLDGANLGTEDTTAPYSITWNTTSATNGSHSLTARARDAAGNQTTSSAVSVAVNNLTPPPVSTKFIVGQRVQTTSNLNVRATASATGTLLGTQSLASLGTIVSGGTQSDGFYWWNVDYDSAPDGYSVEDYLQTYSAPIVGDFNGDGLVNSIDLSLMTSAWNTSNAIYDLNHDGIVNSLDYAVMVQNWSL
jgi:chitodextrinase